MRCSSVLIGDRHPLFLQGLNRVLSVESDFDVVASCCDGACCIEALRNLLPDIAIIDVSIPGMSWLEILSIVNSEKLSTRLVFFTASDEECFLVMSAVADGYSLVAKDVNPEVLVRSLRQIAEGQRLMPRLSYELALSREGAILDSALTSLTHRERQIMRLVSEGLSNKEIGRRLHIAAGTIKVHLNHIFQKLEISNRTVLAALAISERHRAGLSVNKPKPRDLK